MSRASIGPVAALLVALGATAVQAQAPLNLDGDWSARVRVPNGREYDASLRLQGQGGVYQFSLRNTGDPCLGLPTPVTWHPTAEGIEISFQASKALAGCLDSTVPFQRVDDNTWKGRSSRGTEVIFTRKPPG